MDILLVEDERTLAVPLADAMTKAGHRVVTLFDGAAALSWLDEHRCDLVVTDVRLPGADGIAVQQRARKQDPPCEVLVMTGYASVDQAVEAMRSGAVSYLQKPFPMEALLTQVERVASTRALQAEVRRLREQAGEDASRLTGGSVAIETINQRIQKVAAEDVTVLIVGESGTGKERVARALHALGRGQEKPFVPVSCSAIPAGLMEGELFGFKKGSFTGAEEDRTGLLHEAADGTLFLDDVDDVPLEAQAKLLRVLQEREFTQLGSQTAQSFRARVLAASKVPLEEEVAAGRFREDLFFRLNVVPLRLPPLRERSEDIAPLLGELLARWDPENRHRVGPDALRKLVRHPWPGNVRELENALRRALALAGRARILRYEHFLPGGGILDIHGDAEVMGLKEAVANAEKKVIRAALVATQGRKIKAAEMLGISRKVLWQKMKELGLEEDRGTST
ncbi:MAG: sigma-54-dependent Fis family transcriptional regulator [Planctomycetota bacterium]|nr:MAG: sigma-54-dependent Fis family transcriptional regulator [Planctomycetota bacterium]